MERIFKEVKQMIGTDETAQEAERAIGGILYEAVRLYRQVAEDLRFVAKNEAKVVEAKQRIDVGSERLGELKRKYDEKLYVLDRDALGTMTATCVLDFPGWTEKPNPDIRF